MWAVESLSSVVSANSVVASGWVEWVVVVGVARERERERERLLVTEKQGRTVTRAKWWKERKYKNTGGMEVVAQRCCMVKIPRAEPGYNRAGTSERGSRLEN